MAMKPKLWLARGKPPSDSATNIYVISLGGRPEFAPEGWPDGGYSCTHIADCCRQHFERVTGIKLKPGEVREVKSIRFTLVPVKRVKRKHIAEKVLNQCKKII